MQPPSHSAMLWQKIRLAEPRMFSASDEFWHHPDLALVLPQFLMQAHFLMRSGLTLMTAARQEALQRKDDEVARKLEVYLHKHLEEEIGHDRWLLEDICSLGYRAQDIFDVQPCAGVTSLIEAQYFWMRKVHPVALMGYLILMEGYAPLVEQLEEIRLRTGFPASALRCLRAHAEDDPAHLADLNAALDDMPLSVEQASAVSLCAFAAIDGVATMFEQLLQQRAEAGEPGSGRAKELSYVAQ